MRICKRAQSNNTLDATHIEQQQQVRTRVDVRHLPQQNPVQSVHRIRDIDQERAQRPQPIRLRAQGDVDAALRLRIMKRG